MALPSGDLHAFSSMLAVLDVSCSSYTEHAKKGGHRSRGRLQLRDSALRSILPAGTLQGSHAAPAPSREGPFRSRQHVRFRRGISPSDALFRGSVAAQQYSTTRWVHFKFESAVFPLSRGHSSLE